MLPKILVFVLATVSVINATVIVNVYDDDPDIGLLSAKSDCNPTECDQRCRRLKFPGGACVNGRCKCDNFRNAEVEVSENSRLQRKMPCFNWPCIVACSLHKYPAGLCVKGECQCFYLQRMTGIPENNNAEQDNTPQIDEVDSELDKKKWECNSTRCDKFCRILKFTGGACVNGRCKCNNSTIAQDLEPELVNKKSSCNPAECDQRCRRLKFPGGACVNGRCKCDNFRNADQITDHSIPTVVDFVPLQDDFESDFANKKSSCNPTECDQRCRRLKFPGGACVNGRCKCDNFRNAEDLITDNSIPTAVDFVPLQDEFESELANKKSNCNPTECDQRCRRLKFPGGACVNGRCKCDNFRNAEQITDNSIPTVVDFVPLQDDFESDFANKKSSCNPTECDQRCRRLKFPGGACVNGRCKCDNFRNAEDDFELDASPKYSDCSPIGCDQRCRNIGFPGGACVNGRCKCDILRDIQDEYELDPATKYDDCSPIGCDQQCRRIGFHGGVCVNGRCKCDILRDTQDEYELDSATEYNDCSPIGCDQRCRNIGFPGGACVNGRCKCDILRDMQVQEPSLPEPRIPGIFDKLRCNSDVCYKHCTKIGLADGTCKKGICKCKVM
ncbi:tenascin-like isoform X2 [Helicoverpa zea]|uniref:tenascin-like isoform X2 n=1 Tax=Helicoverpa zea TaxID=7113 RepID=UPI001F55D7A6|nr:tenascin-like isoform X2 [Helicoverpa zea]